MKSGVERASRIQRWFGTGPRFDDADGGHDLLPVVTPPDLDNIRSVMLLAVASCSEASRLRIEDRLQHANSPVELWLVRADIFQCLAREVGQMIAARQVAELAPLFRDVLPALQPPGKVQTIAGMPQDFIELYRFQARYNRWINERLYSACEQLSDAERKQDRGAFFGSIHRTLNHIVVTDQVWLRRFARSGVENGLRFEMLEGGLITIPEAYELNAVPFDDWAGLKAKRTQLDEAIQIWTAEMPADYPQMRMGYSNSKGTRRDHPAWQAMTHLFNHQTHHRSQAITLLTQAGVDIGVTDMLALM